MSQTPMTDFERTVVRILQGADCSTLSASDLREAVMAAGFGKHPAAVAMHLTKLAWKNRFVTCWLSNRDERMFTLTLDGRQL